MTNNFFSNFPNINTPPYQGLQQLTALNTKLFNKLAEFQLRLANLGIESSIEQAKLLTGSASYQDFVAAESEFANNYVNKVMEMTREAAEFITESHNEYVTTWAEKSFDKGSEKAAGEVKTKPAVKRSTARKAA